MKLTEAEWKIMRAVWRRTPASGRDVMELLQGETDWSYSTIKTMMTRLVEKGALKSRLRAGTLLYEPLITEDEARQTAVRSILETAFEGSFAPLLRFMFESGKISKREAEQYKRIIEEELKKEKRNE